MAVVEANLWSAPISLPPARFSEDFWCCEEKHICFGVKLQENLPGLVFSLFFVRML